jgi:hypothetical protein
VTRAWRLCATKGLSTRKAKPTFVADVVPVRGWLSRQRPRVARVQVGGNGGGDPWIARAAGSSMLKMVGMEGENDVAGQQGLAESRELPRPSGAQGEGRPIRWDMYDQLSVCR